MVNVLIGNKDIHEDIKNFEFLTDNDEYKIITSSSGIETINKCRINKPDIILLNSNFTDIAYTEIIDKISNLPDEEDKNNLILTVKNPQDKIALKNVSIIYRIYDYPFDSKQMRQTINYLKERYEIPSITIFEIRTLLSRLGLHPYNVGTQYLISAIYKCYTHPQDFKTLDNIYKKIAIDNDISKDYVKSKIRHTIDTFNKLDMSFTKNLYLEIFGCVQFLSSKRFIEIIVDFLYKNKSKS